MCRGHKARAPGSTRRDGAAGRPACQRGGTPRTGGRSDHAVPQTGWDRGRGEHAVPRHDDVRRLGQHRRAGVPPDRRRGARRRDQPRRHRRRLRLRRVRGDPRPGAAGPARRRRAGHEVPRADGRRPQPARQLPPLDRQAVEDSLRRLGTDWIDLYQVHRPDPLTDVDETLGALSDLVRQGKVRCIGTSTFPAEQIVEAQWVGRARRPRRSPPNSRLLDPRPGRRGRRPAHLRRGTAWACWCGARSTAAG